MSIFGQLAACKVSDLLHGMTDLICRAENLVCRKQIAGLLSALGNHTTSTQQMGGDIYKCERRALLHVSCRLPQVPTKVWKENELEIQRSNLFRGCDRCDDVDKDDKGDMADRATGFTGQ